MRSSLSSARAGEARSAAAAAAVHLDPLFMGLLY
jgi:hypothetical protein